MIVVLDAVDDLRHVGEHHRRAVAEGHHHVAIILAADELVVSVDLIILARPVEISLRGVDAGLRQRGTKVLEIDSVRGQLLGIGLDAHGGLLAAADGDHPHAAELRNFRRQPRVDEILDLRERNGVRSDRERQNRRVGGIRLAVNRRRGKVGRQTGFARR